MLDWRGALRNGVAAIVGCSLLLSASPSVAQEAPTVARANEKWTRIFTEEFNDAKLNLNTWTTCYWWDDHGCTNLSNNELQWYLPSNVSVRDGFLQLQARKQQVAGYKGRRFDYTSGIVTTGVYYRDLPAEPRFDFQYGLVEIRAWAPAGQGLWSALWLLPSTRESTPEIDMMEVLGSATNQHETHFHYLDTEGKKQAYGGGVTVGDLSDGWHVYGLRWEREEIVWYLNGKEVRRFADPNFIPAEKMYLLLNLAVGGTWPGDPSAQTKFPSNFLVDYVRVWQRAKS